MQLQQLLALLLPAQPAFWGIFDPLVIFYQPLSLLLLFYHYALYLLGNTLFLHEHKPFVYFHIIYFHIIFFTGKLDCYKQCRVDIITSWNLEYQEICWEYAVNEDSSNVPNIVIKVKTFRVDSHKKCIIQMQNYYPLC